MEPLVEIKNLSIRFPEGNSTFEAVKGISFSIGKGEIVGVVGESGSGKSMSALALMGLLPKDAEIASGSLCFQGEDLVTMKPEKRRQLCGSKMAMVFQEPMTSLNPVLRIGEQVDEVIALHNPDMTKGELKKASQQALTQARASVGAKRETIKITDREWEAIQAGAISENKLTQIIDNVDIDSLRQRATPRATTTLSTAKQNKIASMNASGYSTSEIAEALGISTSTVSNYLN